MARIHTPTNFNLDGFALVMSIFVHRPPNCIKYVEKKDFF
jgi:type III secretory pathway component EscR